MRPVTRRDRSFVVDVEGGDVLARIWGCSLPFRRFCHPAHRCRVNFLGPCVRHRGGDVAESPGV